MKERNHAFDLLCGLCILRMIALHVMSFCGESQTDWWKGVMAWTFFFMCFFFFKAGYFNKTTAGPTKPYLLDRTKRLLVPYVSWALIGNAVYFGFMPKMIAMYRHPIEPITVEMIWTRGQAYGNGPLWFLLSFFTAYVIAHLLDKRRYLPFLVPLFPFISYLCFRLGNPLWLGLNNVFIGVYFFYLGRVWRRLMQWMGRRLTLEFSFFLILYFVVANIFWPAQHTMSSNIFTGSPVVAVLNISAVVCGLSGLLMAIDVRRVPLVSFIGEHSMVFFVAHYPMLYFYKFVHLSFQRSIFGRYDDAIILLPVLLCLCSWLVPYVERVPWLSGRWKQPDSQSK
ncbi:MAG: acyltransferase [Prevotellaceae bacterium]|nr:acyltransferase [Prevotellaceae bacterium]